MRVEVHCINEHGRPLSKADRSSKPAVMGTLVVTEDRLHKSKRVVTCARVCNPSEGGDAEALPELYDVELAWLEGSRIRLRGIEVVNGTHFAQTWDVRIVKC